MRPLAGVLLAARVRATLLAATLAAKAREFGVPGLAISLVALTLLLAESPPARKDTLVGLVVELLGEPDDP